MAQEGVYVFPDAATKSAVNGIDPGLLALLNQNGGFGGNGNWIWILFLWMMWRYGWLEELEEEGKDFDLTPFT